MVVLWGYDLGCWYFTCRGGAMALLLVCRITTHSTLAAVLDLR